MDPDAPDAGDLTTAQSALTALLATLPSSAWTLRTACEEWDVAAVVRHVVVGERAFTVSLGGSPYDLPSLIAAVADVSDGDLVATYDETSSALRAALAAAGDGPFPTGLGPMPAPAVARLRTIEALTHGWDVARAVGGSLDVGEEVAERAIRHSRELMAALPPGRTPFGPEQPADPDAPALDRLAALLGRRPA